MRLLLRLAAVTALALGVIGEAGGAQVKITGIYSDLHFIAEAGDLLGTEIMIVPARGGEEWVVFHQHWEGYPRFPVVVPASVKRDRITFEVRYPPEEDEKPEPATEYEGRITTAGFEGIRRYPLANGTMAKEPVKLPRKKSYWE